MTRLRKTLGRRATSAVVAAALAVSGLLPSATAAVAGGYGPRYGGYHYAPPPPPPHAYHYGYAQPHYYDYERERRKKRRNNVAKAIAIGAGVAILGAIIANSGRRHR